MGRLTTHVLDTALGRPAAGIAVTLYRIDSSGGREKLGDFTPTPTDGATARCWKARRLPPAPMSWRSRPAPISTERA